MLLNDEEWSKWSDSEIARRCRVSHPFVAKLRPVTGNVSGERTYTTRHGTVAQMDTSRIGSRPAPAEQTQPPAANLVQLAPGSLYAGEARPRP